MNYNLLNLSSREFENLCADILTKYINKECRTFADGRDGGIDIRPVNGDNSIIGQCKRHKDPNSAKNEIIKEVRKIYQKNVKKYYIFISCELTPNNLDDIYNTYKDYMKDQTHIFDGVRICSLLDTEEYKYILRKHFKLWACSERVLALLQNKAITHDTDTLINNIENHKEYYVETSDSIKVYKELLDKRIILIKGEPGVGKSTVSEITVMKMLANIENLSLIYSSYGSINKIKDKLSLNYNEKELIYIDDFLGQIYFDLQQDKIRNIIGFIDTIKRHKNKYLLLNTRITVLNEASKQYKSFSNSIDKIGIHQIELKNISRFEKAKILYNHFYFSDISDSEKKVILDNKNYFKIIDHKNYNPRLIEYICKKNNFKLVDCTYLDFILNSLNNPKEIWSEPFKYKLKGIDKLFLYTLYGINDDYVQCELHKQAFNKLEYLVEDRDRMIDNYDECYTRLIDSYITAAYDYSDNRKLIKILNPSISDVIKEYFDKFNNADYKKHLIIFEQYLRAYESFFQTKKFKKLIESREIEKLHFNNSKKIYPIIEYFVIEKEPKIDLKKYYINIICYKNLGAEAYPYGKSIEYCFGKLTNKKFLDFYDINDINDDQFIEMINNVFYILNNEKIIEVINYLDFNRVKTMLQKSRCIEITVDKIYTSLDMFNIIYDICENKNSSENENLNNTLFNKLYQIILEEIANNKISEIYERLGLVIDDDEILEVVCQYDMDKEIEEFYKELQSDYDNYDYYKEQQIEKEEEEREIELLFSKIA